MSIATKNRAGKRAPVLFRCDANADSGLGHVSRCLGLAEAFQEMGYSSVFAGDYSSAGRILLESAGMLSIDLPPLTETTDAVDSLRSVGSIGAGMVVIDSYRTPRAHLAELDRSGVPTVLVDDFGRVAAFPCSVVLNFTVDAACLPYRRDESEQLLGPRYMLVRRRFRQLRSRPREISGPVQRVLVAIGGTDRHGLTLRLVRALAQVAPGLIVRVAAGAGPVEVLAEALASFPAGSGAFARQPDLADEFAAADVCISGGGLTKYESAYLGVPQAVFSQTEDQAGETVKFAGHGLAFDLGLGPRTSDEQLTGELKRFLEARHLHAQQSAAGRAIFPADPTMEAAMAIVKAIDAEEQESDSRAETPVSKTAITP